MDNFIREQLKALPLEVYDYLLANKGDEISVLIVRKYRLGWEGAKRLSELLRRLFLRKISPQDLPTACQRLFGTDEVASRQLACDIAGARLLVVADWLQADIAALIRAWGGDPARYQPHVEALKKGVTEQRRWEQEQLSVPTGMTEEAGAELSDEDREDFFRQLFSGGLLQVLRTGDALMVKEMNGDLISQLSTKPEFKNQLVGLLFANQERLTSQDIVLDGRVVSPTIGHWLEYFIRLNGADVFDMVAASSFITNAEAAKILNENERRLLLALLSLYRQLKFFPSVQGNSNPETWQILPVADGIDEALEPVEGGDILTESSTAAPAVWEQRWAEPASPAPTAAPSQTPKAELPVSEALRLQQLLAKYPEGSLERLAIEEELKKYQ